MQEMSVRRVCRGGRCKKEVWVGGGLVGEWEESGEHLEIRVSGQ